METLSGNRPSPPPPPQPSLFPSGNSTNSGTLREGKKKLESKYSGNFCAYTDNPPNIIKYFSPLHPQDISLETIPCRYKKKNPQKALETPTVRIRACIKKSWNDFSLKKKICKFIWEKEQREEKVLWEKTKIKGKLSQTGRSFFPLRRKFFSS